jgi:lipopolysaccharide biosynthesis glycosyltransferase
MKKNAVVFTISKDLTFAVANLIFQIKDLCPSIADVFVIYHNGISSNEKNIIQKICNVKFIKYELPADINIFNKSTLSHFTEMAFAKYECIKLLNEFKNVIYLDPDIVILKDLSFLLNKSTHGISMIPGDARVSDQLYEDVEEFDMEQEGICACFFVLQDHLEDFNKKYDFCIEYLYKYANNLYLAEQAIFDFMIQHFKIKYDVLENRKYTPHPSNFGNDALLIHSFGTLKFWNGITNDTWNQYDKKWNKLGGKSWTFIKKVKRLFQKIKSKF